MVHYYYVGKPKRNENEQMTAIYKNMNESYKYTDIK